MMNEVKTEDELMVIDSYAPQIAAEQAVLTRFFGVSADQLPRKKAGGADSTVFQLRDDVLLKVFDGLHVRSEAYSSLPQHVLQWYFEQSREVGAFLEQYPNPLNQSLVDRDSGETYKMHYRVSDPGQLIEQNGVVGAKITDVCTDGPVPFGAEALAKQVIETQGFFVKPLRDSNTLPFNVEMNARYRVDIEAKIIYVTFTDIDNVIVSLYWNQKGLLSGPKSLISKRTRERVAAST